MGNILDFNLPALFVIVLLMFSAAFRKMTRSTTGHIFFTLLLDCLLSAIFATAAVHLQNYCLEDPSQTSAAIVTLRYFVHYGYLLTHNMTTPIYIIYIISLTDTWHLLRSNKAMKFFITVPYALIVLIMLINIPTKSVFYIDSNCYYTRGKLFPLLYAVAFAYLVYGFVFLRRHKDLFPRDTRFSLYSIFPFMIAAIALQCVNREYQVEMFAKAVSLLLITITIERPEHQIDTVTGLKKHSAYVSDMRLGFQTSKPVTIIAINIANFNTITGIAGFETSTELLVRLSHRLEQINAEQKTAAVLYYLDRGRFRVVLSHIHREKAGSTAEAINNMFHEKIELNGMEFNLRAHVCILRCPEDINDFKALMKFGEDFHIRQPYTGSVTDISNLKGAERISVTNQLDHIIEKAITNRNLKVYYQPIYSVKEKRFTSAEALLRLIDDEYGFIPPNVFIPAAEKNGAIIRIGEYVIDEVCRFISEGSFKELGLDYIEINLSVAQCMQTDLAQKILNSLEQHKVDPKYINLEITETAANYAQDIMTANLTSLTEHNVKFSLDDYGTGYSNIISVASLPLKIVKLDKTFVDEIKNPKMKIILESTIKMLKDMDMEIVVEGVETKDMSEKFAELECDFIQGYYYSRPLPENDFVNFIMNAGIV